MLTASARRGLGILAGAVEAGGPGDLLGDDHLDDPENAERWRCVEAAVRWMRRMSADEPESSLRRLCERLEAAETLLRDAVHDIASELTAAGPDEVEQHPALAARAERLEAMRAHLERYGR